MARDYYYFDDSEIYEGYYVSSRRKKERGGGSAWFFILLALLVAAFFGFRYYWTHNFGGVTVSGRSMYNTLYDGEQLVMKFAKDKSDVKRGDIIVVDVSEYPDVIEYNQNLPEASKLSLIIKRLIAVEGDVVECKSGQVFITYAGTTEAVPLEEPYAYYYSNAEKATYDFGPYEVGAGEIFFLGDNRLNSKDSRYNEEQGSHLKNGLYKAEDILGVVPDWAMEHQEVLEFVFFRNKKK